MIRAGLLLKLTLKNWAPIRSMHRRMAFSTLGMPDSSKDVYKDGVRLCFARGMGERNLLLSKDAYYHLLQRCIDEKNLEEGETIYYLIASEGYYSDAFLGTHVIRMFGSFGKIREAKHVFSGLLRPTVYAWSAIILAYAILGQSKQALELYQAMNQAGVRPDSHTFVTILKVCVNDQDLKAGMLVHSLIVEHGLESMDHIGGSVIRLYAQLYSPEDARLVFDRVVKPSVVLWTDMIHGYAQNEYSAEAFVLFGQMQLKGVQSNQVTFVCIMKACATIEAFMEGMLIHSLIIEASAEVETFLGSSLVVMYAKCGMLHDAQETFERLHKEDVAEWNAIITGEAQHGGVQEALQLHNRMRHYGVESSQRTYTSILKVCANTRTLYLGKQVHAYMIGSRVQMDALMSNALINLYARCGDIENACIVFKQSDKRNAASWAALMAGCADHGHDKMAFCFFEQMRQEGTLPNNATFLSILGACSNIRDLNLVHVFILEDGFDVDAAVASNLIGRYGKFESFLDALDIFEHLQDPDVVSWNAIIMASTQLSRLEIAFWLFCRMQKEGERPDNVSFNTMISACAWRGFLSEALELFQQMEEPDAEAICCVLQVCLESATQQVGKLIHEQVVERGMEVNSLVGEALISMYLMHEDMDDAQRVFDTLEPRDVNIWNAMISGYLKMGPDLGLSSLTEQVQGGGLEGAPEASTTSTQDFLTSERVLELYCQMNKERTHPDQTTFVYILKACSRMTASDHGKQVHTHIVEAGLDQDLMIGNILIHLYAQFGSFEDAYRVFGNMCKRNVVTFNTLFAACAQHSNLELVLHHFCAMRQGGVKPDGATFLSLFSACGRAGKQGTALFFFRKMREVYGVEPTYAHYTCVVDLVGRKGFLKEGEDLLGTTPFRPNVVGLTSILSHCRIHGSISMVRGGIDELAGKRGHPT